MNTFKTKVRFICLNAFIIFTLSACGGGASTDAANEKENAIEEITKLPESGKNITPKANAGANKSVQVNTSLVITGSGTDSDGSIASYKWQKDGAVIATSASFDYIPTTIGTYTLTLTVTDDDGDSASDTMKVIVSAAPSTNKAPTANAGANKTVQVNKSIVITGSGSDSDGTITYQWKKGSKTLANKASFNYTPTKVGTDTLKLIVTDNDGTSATDTMNVVVSAASPVPVSDTTPPVITLLGDKVTRVVHKTPYKDAGATAVDNKDGNITAAIVITGDTVNANAVVGTTFIIKYNVMDAAKNSAAQVTRTVAIIAAPDTTDPIITLKGKSPLEVIKDSNYIDAGATALDDRDGNISANIVVGGDTVDTSLPLGSTFIITYNVKDAANNPAIEKNRSVSIIEGSKGGHKIPVLSKADKQIYLTAINNARTVSRTCPGDPKQVPPILEVDFPATVAVKWSDKLYKAAYEHSQDMTESDTFSHSGSGTASDWSGSALNKQSSMVDRVATYGYNWSLLSENISAGTNRDTAQKAMDSWLNSPGHCRNIMNADFTEVGMALSSNKSANYTHYWTQKFGKPR